ncbi:MAG: hypothetical protein Q7K57_20450 [Burkholderiaceae bacterium]|nr:hypothetical protein [Burkholderiaceae bacterium]
MGSTTPKIKPESITKPYQLAAAVLVGIAAIDVSFFVAAGLLTSPQWIPPLLVISAVVLTASVLIGVYLVVTKHRHAMQDDTHFSKDLDSKNKAMKRQVTQLSAEIEKERLLASQREELTIAYLNSVTQRLPIGVDERYRLERAVRDSIQAGEDRASQELSQIFIDRAANALPLGDPNLTKLIESVVQARNASTAAAYGVLVQKDVRAIDLVADLHRVVSVMTSQRGCVRSPVPPVLVRATPGIVEVVLRELLLNATVYSPPDSLIEVDVTGNADHVEVTIVNDLMPGTSVSQEWMLPTVRGEGSSGQYANGVGMGLPLVNRIIALIDGELRLQQVEMRLELTIKFQHG